MLKVQKNWFSGSKQIWKILMSFHLVIIVIIIILFLLVLAVLWMKTIDHLNKTENYQQLLKGWNQLRAWKTSHKHNKDLNQLQ